MILRELSDRLTDCSVELSEDSKSSLESCTGDIFYESERLITPACSIVCVVSIEGATAPFSCEISLINFAGM